MCLLRIPPLRWTPTPDKTVPLCQVWSSESTAEVSRLSNVSRRTLARWLQDEDFRALSDDQLATAEDIFNDFRNRGLKPAYLADADPNRSLLDRRVVCDLLSLDESIYEGVRRSAPPLRQVVRRTLRPRRQSLPQKREVGGVGAVNALPPLLVQLGIRYSHLEMKPAH